MKVAVIDYNAGNVRSVLFALGRWGAEGILTSDPSEILSADKVIFPGVGEASSAMEILRQRRLDEVIPAIRQPFLGICLGMQLMCLHSEEGNTDCLGVFPVKVKRFQTMDPSIKIPHVGWNQIQEFKDPIFAKLNQGDHVYYVHSYYAEMSDYTSATTHYIHPFSAALIKENFHAVQFHPEKSGPVGEKILESFLTL